MAFVLAATAEIFEVRARGLSGRTALKIAAA
jgi:hypothetical protein